MKKNQNRSVFGGKHFTTAPPKDGRTNEVYFEKKHNWISDVSAISARGGVLRRPGWGMSIG